MGVHGLTSYVMGNSSLYLKPYKLSDCYVVIDGTNIAHEIASGLKSHSAFGGDYDEYYTLVRSFMFGLKKCNVYPIVLFDGGCEKDKIKTRLNRKHDTILKLDSFCQGFSMQNFCPLFMVNVFQNVVRDMGLIYAQCNVEADGEIAAVAKKLNCPVVSYDSDYFIYDVIYIPVNTVKLSPLKYPNSNKYYIECSVYIPDEFLKTVGIDKPLLPFLATLLGTDHVENVVFSKFFNHIKLKKRKHQSRAQKRVCEVIEWLKNEDLTSAVNHIISHLRKKDAERVSKLFNRTIKFYSTHTISEAVSNELAKKFGEIHFVKSNINVNWPSEIAKLFAEGFIPNFSMNIILHQVYLTPLQVENLYDHSSHLKSLNLIRKIYTMLAPYAKTEKQLKLYLIVKKQYTSLKMGRDPSHYINLHEVIKQPQEKRLQLLCDLVGVSMDDFKFVPQNSWAVFIISFLYWIKEYNKSVSLAHIHAFVIMMIANKIVQCKVGYYRNSPDFMKRYGAEINKLKDTEVFLNDSSNFEEMLSSVRQYECLVVQKELIPLRRTTPEGSGRAYCLSTIHLFNCFQSCLYFIIIINALLNHPLPHLKVEEFYSGTLLFNVYTLVKSKTRVDKFGSSLFFQTPNLDQIYKYLCVKLSECSGLTRVNYRSVRRRRRTKKHKRSLNVVEHIHCPTDDEGEFVDENNMYSFLNKVKDLSIT